MKKIDIRFLGTLDGHLLEKIAMQEWMIYGSTDNLLLIIDEQQNEDIKKQLCYFIGLKIYDGRTKEGKMYKKLMTVKNNFYVKRWEASCGVLNIKVIPL